MWVLFAVLQAEISVGAETDDRNFFETIIGEASGIFPK